MNSAQNQKFNPEVPLSFEDVSKLFALPLSEAADILGVSTSALKRLCNENGLERWPHRKYLSGKSIEEIKNEAAREKRKMLAERQKSPSPGFHAKDKTPRSAPEFSKTQNNGPQSASRNTLVWRSNHMITSGLAIESSTSFVEFKFGFPAAGFSRITNKWWGSASDVQVKTPKDDLKTGPEARHASEAQGNETNDNLLMEKSDSIIGDSSSDNQDNVSLSTIRKRAVDEGRKALKMGILKKHRGDKLGEEDQILLRHLFQTSFPVDDCDAVPRLTTGGTGIP